MLGELDIVEAVQCILMSKLGVLMLKVIRQSGYTSLSFTNFVVYALNGTFTTSFHTAFQMDGSTSAVSTLNSGRLWLIPELKVQIIC